MDDVQSTSPVTTSADPACRLWIRRQVFEHSVAVPLLTKSVAEQIDFTRLATSMAAVSVPMDPDDPPAITFQSWIELAAKHAHLDTQEEAGIIVEALETNAPNAFVRCNDPEKLAPGRQVDYRQLLIPVPELIAFLRLHAAATLAARFRETADAVWPSPSSADLPISPSTTSPSTSASTTPVQHVSNIPTLSSASASQAPALSPTHSPSRRSHTQQGYFQHHPQQIPHNHHAQGTTAEMSSGNLSPTRTPVVSPPRVAGTPPAALASPSFLSLRSHSASPQHPPGSPVHGLDGMVRKKSQPHSPASAMLNSSSAIVASVTHSLQRETHLVASSMTALLRCIAATYGILPSSEPTSNAIDLTGSLSTNGNIKDLPSASPHASLSRTDRCTSCTASVKKNDSSEKQNAAIDTANSSLRASVGARQGSKDNPGGQALSRLLFPASSGGPGSVTSDTSTTRTAGVNGLMIHRNLFEHLSFLLTTTYSDSGKRRSISSVVPEWRDTACTEPVSLGRLVEIATAALTKIPIDPGSGPVDTAEIRDLERKTVIRTKLPETNCDETHFPHGREVRITNCSESFIYLLCSLGRVSFIGCRECTLFVGSCVSLSIIGCDRVRVHVIARICRLTNCFDTDIYLCTNRRPQIVGDSRRIAFAPYNVAYPYVRRDLAAVGVDPSRNIWNEFYRPSLKSVSSSVNASSTSGSPSSSSEAADLTAGMVGVLPHQRFLPFAIPALLDSQARSASDQNGPSNASGLLEHDPSSLRSLFKLEVPLPPEYHAAIVDRQKQVESLLNQVHKVDDEKADVAMTDSSVPSEPAPMSSPPGGVSLTAGAGHEARSLTQSIVIERFHEWLTTSGHMRQINDLTRLEADASR